MENAEMILDCRYLVTMADDKLKEKHSIVINHGKITDILPSQECTDLYWTASLKHLDKIVMPGFVNSHNHSPMLFYRGLIPEGTLLDIVLSKYMFPVEAKLSTNKEIVYEASKAAAIEMLNAGTTTTAEMYYHPDVIMQAYKEMGIRAIVGETVMSVMETPSAKTPNQAIKNAEFAKQFNTDLVEAAIAPHAIYTVDAAALILCGDACRDLGMRLFMHSNENFSEMDLLYKRGMRYPYDLPITYCSSLGMFNDLKVTLAHCCFLDDEHESSRYCKNELNPIRKHDIGIALNPVSNALTGAPKLDSRIFHNGIRVGLGSDGPMTNDRIDMLSQLKPAIMAYNNKLSSFDIVKMATIGSARALHLEDKIGTIEIGKEADIIGLKLTEQSLPYLEHSQIFQYIVRFAQPSDVMFRMVKGKILPYRKPSWKFSSRIPKLVKENLG